MTKRKINLLENFTNTHFEKELDYLFGDESKIVINNIKYLSHKKSYLIDVTINVTDIDYSVESYPVGLEHFISESCKLLKLYGETPVIVTSIKLKE